MHLLGLTFRPVDQDKLLKAFNNNSIYLRSSLENNSVSSVKVSFVICNFSHFAWWLKLGIFLHLVKASIQNSINNEKKERG